MTDIFELVHEDESSFDFEIMGRSKDGVVVGTGVIWNIRDIGNRDSQLAMKRERNVALGRRAKTKEAISDEEVGAMMTMASTDPTDEMLAHCVTGWDWGDKTLGKYKLKFTYDNVLAIIKGEPGIRSQLLMKVLEISGFMKA